jgi:Kdo2-lipid IVA lauroyltransferase/acyltransferase
MTEEPAKDEPRRETQVYIRPKDIDNRATRWQRIQWRLESWAWNAIYWYPMKALPIETAAKVCAGIVKALGPLTSQNKTVRRNLKLAFPDWTEAKLAEVSLGAWDTMGRVAGELPHLAELQPYVADARVEIAGTEHVAAIKASGKPAVLIGAHLANWEVMSAAICRSLDCEITYRALNNPYIDRLVADARYSAGIDVLVPKGAGTRELMRSLARGRSVGLMNDQKFNQGVAAPFFGHDAMTAPGATRLAMKFGVPIMPLSVLRTGDARYRVTFHEPFMPEQAADDDVAIQATVARINRFYEDRIREAPEQWFWMHNRWPKEAWVKAGVI